MSDPYVYPGTNVLRNTLDIRDFDDLQEAERRLSAWRMATVPKTPITYAGYRQIHKHLFQDIYDWAGKPRTVNIAKGRDTFAFAEYIDPNMRKLFDDLAKEKTLKGLKRDAFADRAAWYLGEINAVHPFREGNGRTQRAFLKTLAQQAGWKLDLRRIEPAPWHEASVESFKRSHQSMATLIDHAVTGPTRGPTRTRRTGRGRGDSGRDR